MVRKSTVSGTFYPAEKERLIELIEKFRPKDIKKVLCKGIVIPHAGYNYSGKVAVATVAKALPLKRVIILGPNHTGEGAPFALWGKGFWDTPLGAISIDEKLATAILKSGAVIEEDYLAHEFEHSIEVELPILYNFFGDFKFVPISCKQTNPDTYRAVAQQIFEAVKTIKEDILLVASSDMTHYEIDASARRKDRLAIETMIALDEDALISITEREQISMCGIAPVAIFISCLKNMGAKKASVILYQTSGDVTGDYNSVVGYGGIIFQ